MLNLKQRKNLKERAGTRLSQLERSLIFTKAGENPEVGQKASAANWIEVDQEHEASGNRSTVEPCDHTPY